MMSGVQEGLNVRSPIDIKGRWRGVCGGVSQGTAPAKGTRLPAGKAERDVPGGEPDHQVGTQESHCGGDAPALLVEDGHHSSNAGASVRLRVHGARAG